jgi:two-component system, NtrC family, sensor kinase
MSESSLDDILNTLAVGQIPEPVVLDEAWPKSLCLLISYMREVRELALAFSRGDLKPIPSTGRGPVIGSLKALQASLRHLLWQTQQVAAGDYSQHTEFLGEFSVAFNTMITQLNERKKLEQQVHQAKKLEAVGQLAGGMAHEMNTPLQYINDNLSFLKESIESVLTLQRRYRAAFEVFRQLTSAEAHLAELKAAEDAADIEYLEEQIPEAFHQSLAGFGQISQLIKALKEFAQPEQKKKVFANINQALTDVLHIAHSQYVSIAEARLIAGEIPPVHCYIGEMNQAFLSLLLNATQAIAEKQQQAPCQGLIQIRTRNEDSGVCIEFEDNGVGIPKEIGERIFEPFFTTRTIGQGIGLGLASAWTTIVDKHQGSLSFTSQPGNGSVFFLRLPV